MKEVPFLAEAFAQVLQEARCHARLSQQALACQIKCARSYISFMETKNNLPGLNAFIVISNALDITPDEFMKRVCSKAKLLCEINR